MLPSRSPNSSNATAFTVHVTLRLLHFQGKWLGWAHSSVDAPVLDRRDQTWPISAFPLCLGQPDAGKAAWDGFLSPDFCRNMLEFLYQNQVFTHR